MSMNGDSTSGGDLETNHQGDSFKESLVSSQFEEGELPGQPCIFVTRPCSRNHS